MVAMPQRNMMAASHVDGATFFRMMLLGTCKIYLAMVKRHGESIASGLLPWALDGWQEQCGHREVQMMRRDSLTSNKIYVMKNVNKATL